MCCIEVNATEKGLRGLHLTFVPPTPSLELGFCRGFRQKLLLLLLFVVGVMATTVETLLEDVRKHRKNLARFVRKLEDCEDDEAARRLSDNCVQEIAQYRKYMQLAKTEINAIADPDDQERFNTMRKTEKKKFKKEEGKFKALDNHSRDRQQLLESETRGRRKKKPQTNRDYGEEGVKIAEDTTARLRDALNTVRDADDIAVATAEELVNQGETINRIQNKVGEIDQDLNRADKLITQFVKRMYTDKIILALTCLVFCAIAFIVIYASLNSSQDTFDVPDTVKVPEPSNVQNTVTRRLAALRGAPSSA